MRYESVSLKLYVYRRQNDVFSPGKVGTLEPHQAGDRLTLGPNFEKGQLLAVYARA